MKKLFTTGEFAKLCNVSKDTILYYDKIGLLKPDEILDNGYRYYNLDKYWNVMMIKMLGESEMTLKEIGSYLDNMDNCEFCRLLEEHSRLLNEQKNNLDFRIKCNEIMVQQTQNFLGLEEGRVVISRQDKDEYYLQGEIVEVSEITPEVITNSYRMQRALLEKENYYNSLIDIEYMVFDENKLYSGFLSMVIDEYDNDNLYIKPKGDYLRISFMNLDEHDNNYKKIRDFAKEHNLVLDKSYYHVFLPSHFTEICGYTEVKIL